MCTLLVKVEKEVKQAKTKLLHFRLPNICTTTISLESKSLRNQYPPIPTENVEGNLLGEGGREFPVMEFHDDSSLEFTSQRRLPSPPPFRILSPTRSHFLSSLFPLSFLQLPSLVSTLWSMFQLYKSKVAYVFKQPVVFDNYIQYKYKK